MRAACQRGHGNSPCHYAHFINQCFGVEKLFEGQSIISFCHLNQFHPQEIYYYLSCGNIVRNDDLTKESTEVSIRDAGNKELTEALTTGDGLLKAGLQPEVSCATEGGQKALLESVAGEMEENKAKPNKRRGTQNSKPEKVEPKTLEEPLDS